MKKSVQCMFLYNIADMFFQKDSQTFKIAFSNRRLLILNYFKVDNFTFVSKSEGPAYLKLNMCCKLILIRLIIYAIFVRKQHTVWYKYSSVFYSSKILEIFKNVFEI